jgi:hypothetical protein
MIVWYSGAIITGSILGICFYYIFRQIVPHGFTSRYLASLGQNIHGLLRGDFSLFWKFYRNIIGVSFHYAGLQLLGVILGLIPLIIVMMATGSWLQSHWNSGAPVTVIPAKAGKLIASLDDSSAEQSAQPAGTGPAAMVGRTYKLVLKGGYQQPLDDPLANYVVCSTDSIVCSVLQTFAFRKISVDPSRLVDDDILIIRAQHDDRNPFWPYLSDPEFLFFLSFFLISVVLMLRKKKVIAPEGAASYDISLVDYIFTWIATRYAGAMCALGNLESRIMACRLAEFEVKKPIFITGLARAGTTILLETLNTADNVATHRYRDFPFIMTPIFWNRFVSLFAAKQDSIERPHKDRIKITRESPDAFEEPIWQHFFPFLHDPEALHQLDSDATNTVFEKFYYEHIQKILLIRKGSRYLSKGNYNLTRIEYISSIFSDARYLISIRHPLLHVESLVRQHRIFKDYAIQNPQVPEYLKSVGHYEFGPQRRPVCLTRAGADRIVSAWENGDDHLGYAIQWAEIYSFVARLQAERADLTERILVIRYEDFCSDPRKEIQRILKFSELNKLASASNTVQKIRPPSRPMDLSECQIEACWKTVEDVASIYGYTINPVETNAFSRTSLLAKSIPRVSEA